MPGYVVDGCRSRASAALGAEVVARGGYRACRAQHLACQSQAMHRHASAGPWATGEVASDARAKALCGGVQGYGLGSFRAEAVPAIPGSPGCCSSMTSLAAQGQRVTWCDEGQAGSVPWRHGGLSSGFAGYTMEWDGYMELGVSVPWGKTATS